MDIVLHAERLRWWKADYRISVENRPLFDWVSHAWTTGGSFLFDGRRYVVRANALNTRYRMTDPAGQVVAVADRVGRKHWSVTADGRTHHFDRASVWRREQRLVDGGRPVGGVRPASGGAVAELPGLPPLTQAFVLATVLTAWNLETTLTVVLVSLIPLWITLATAPPFT